MYYGYEIGKNRKASLYVATKLRPTRFNNNMVVLVGNEQFITYGSPAYVESFVV